MDKRSLRAEYRALRDGIDPSLRREWSARICAFAAEIAAPGETAFVYAAVGSEVETEQLIRSLRQKGCRVCLPVVRGKGHMDAAVWAPGDRLTAGQYGIPAPESGETVPPQQIDIAYVPLLAWDLSGARLGYGGGYYDRFLIQSPARRFALAYSVQQAAALVRQAWDVPMDAVITEAGIVCCQTPVR